MTPKETAKETPRAKQAGGPTRSNAQTLPDLRPPQTDSSNEPAGEKNRYSLVAPRDDVSRLTTLDRYLASLPNGIDSYAGTLTKATVVGQMTTDSARRPPVNGLPAPLEALIHKPPSARAWIPVVHLCALHAAMFDAAFGDDEMPSFRAWMFDVSRRVLDGPFYRALLAVRGPERLLEDYKTRWGTFHRGTELHVLQLARRRMTVRMVYPAHAWPDVSRMALEEGLRVGVLMAGAAEVDVRSAEESPTAARIDIRWT